MAERTGEKWYLALPRKPRFILDNRNLFPPPAPPAPVLPVARCPLPTLDPDSSQLATATAQVGNANSSNPDGHSAEIAEAEVRRLKVELDQKRSEIDIAIKETDTVRAELKEMKALFNAAGQQADAAGADEETLRKRLSQLMCENGLLKGEKDRREALDASMKMESRSAAARAAGEVERLERELQVGMMCLFVSLCASLLLSPLPLLLPVLWWCGWWWYFRLVLVSPVQSGSERRLSVFASFHVCFPLIYDQEKKNGGILPVLLESSSLGMCTLRFFSLVCFSRLSANGDKCVRDIHVCAYIAVYSFVFVCRM